MERATSDEVIISNLPGSASQGETRKCPSHTLDAVKKALYQLRSTYRFSANEAPLKVCVDDAGCLWSCHARLDGPCPCFLPAVERQRGPVHSVPLTTVAKHQLLHCRRSRISPPEEFSERSRNRSRHQMVIYIANLQCVLRRIFLS